MSLLAILVVVGISMYNEDLNVGILAIALSICVAAIFAGISSDKVMRAWPIDLFMILAGVTFLFGIATTNGTMDKVTANAIRLASGRTVYIPLIIFVLTNILSMIGPGNIISTAMMAPVALAIAWRINMSAFLMTLLVVGAASGGSFSPVAPAGIISTYFVTKMAPQLAALGQDVGNIDLLSWKILFNTQIAQLVGNVGGFLILGGWTWIMAQRAQTSVNIDEIAPKPQPFTVQQWLTVGAIALLLLLVVLPSVPVVGGLFPKWLLNVIGNGKTGNIGSIAFILAAVLLVANAGDSKAAVKSMPWSVIIMVCGMGILIDVMDKAGGLNALVNIIAAVSTPTTVTGVVALVDGIISVYSSSSGVVVPMFLPLVPGLIEQLHGGSAVAIISSINVGSHMVDTSPLSTLGAICIACAAEGEDKGKLFRALLIWGFAMAAVGAVLCYVFFGLLNL
jgi:di/tricarboxylate transporter